MKVNKIITTTEKCDLQITGATLLSIEEAEALPLRLRYYYEWWLLRSKGNYQCYIAFVDRAGSVNNEGCGVTRDADCVRPALIINLKSSNFKIGDVFIFDDKEFEIISENLAFCKSDIGHHCFREDWEAEDANDYEVSDVKEFVDEWFERSIEK